MRKEDGSKYTPRSISMFMAGLQRYILNEKNSQVKLIDSGSSTFRQLHHVLENRSMPKEWALSDDRLKS